jgi:siderophore synthetase component
LAPHSVLNAPLITDWLRAMIDTDRYLSDELQCVLLGEVVGVAYRSGASLRYEDEAPESSKATSAGLLSAIWRESLHRYLQPGEAAAPFTALCHIDAHGEPFIAKWIADQGVEPWVGQLLEVAIVPVIHLLCGHGVALGAHAQNLILIHANGWPRRLALRDVHDIRFSPAHLARPEARPHLHPTPAGQFHRNYYLEAKTAEEVRDFMHDAFFFVNLSELALFLDDYFGLSERRFWSIARQIVVSYQRRFPHQAKRYANFDLLGPTVQVEQLTTRRLLPDIDERIHAVLNPLSLALGHHGAPETSEG